MSLHSYYVLACLFTTPEEEKKEGEEEEAPKAEEGEAKPEGDAEPKEDGATGGAEVTIEVDVEQDADKGQAFWLVGVDHKSGRIVYYMYTVVYANWLGQPAESAKKKPRTLHWSEWLACDISHA